MKYIHEFETAVWECPRCGRVLSHTFSNMVSYSLEGNLWCTCYGLEPARRCVERRSITKMTPLNDAARNHEAACIAIREHQEKRAQFERQNRERAQEYLDSWGWAPATKPWPRRWAL